MKTTEFRKTWIYQTKDGRIITLRTAETKDAEKILNRIAIVIKEGDYLEEEIRTINNKDREIYEIKKMKEQGSMYTVAEMDGQIIGAVQLHRGNLKMNRHITSLRVWIGPKYRGIGLGKKMMQYAIEWAKNQEIEKICLDVFSNNEAAIQMYKKYGFIIEGRRKRQFILQGLYVDEVFMSKFL